MITYDTLLCLSMICSSTVVVFASNKGPINYLKVLVNNKKTDKPAKVMPISRVISANPATTINHASTTGLTLRDVYLHVTTEVPRSSTTDYGGKSNQAMADGDKTATRHQEDDALVQRMCSDIISAVHRKIGEQSTGAAASSGATAHRKSESQQQRWRYSYRKLSPRPVGYNERRESGSVTIGPDDRYHDPILAQETSRVDYLTSYPLAKSCNGIGAVNEEDDDPSDEDADQAPKVWKLNMAGEHAMFNSAKSREPRSGTSVADIDDERR